MCNENRRRKPTHRDTRQILCTVAAYLVFTVYTMNTQKEKLVYHADEVEKKREGLHAFARNHRLFARKQKTLFLRTHTFMCICGTCFQRFGLSGMKNRFFHSLSRPSFSVHLCLYL